MFFIMTVQRRELSYCVCDGEMVRESCSHMEECEECCSALVLCGVCDWTSTAWHFSPGPVFVQKPQTAADPGKMCVDDTAADPTQVHGSTSFIFLILPSYPLPQETCLLS